jgi:hypothetical protein
MIANMDVTYLMPSILTATMQDAAYESSFGDYAGQQRLHEDMKHADWRHGTRWLTRAILT